MNSINQSSLSLLKSNLSPYTQLTTYHDENFQLMWYYMHGSPRPCFTPILLEELQQFRDNICREIDEPNGRDIKYLVLASDVPEIFSLGGDLQLLKKFVVTKDRDGLFQYAKACIDLLYANYTHLDRDITTIALVQGDALGGGFEGAMASNFLIAERSARMGLPEILFNLFPGMGAYSLLSRKLDSARAEKLILSGKVYTAEELYDMGIVDMLAEDHQGERAVYDYIKRENKSYNGYRALRAAKNCVNPITYDELLNITEIWVDAALRLEPRDLRMMERLVSRQTKLDQYQKKLRPVEYR
jgi:DSF synthase